MAVNYIMTVLSLHTYIMNEKFIVGYAHIHKLVEMSANSDLINAWAISIMATIVKAAKDDSNNSNTDTNNDEGEESARKLIRLVFSVSYFILFLFGTFGNGIVIIMIVNVMTSAQKNRSNIIKANPSSTFHVFIYVLGLSVVDFLVIMHLPFLIVDLMFGQWLFGNVMCKLYWFGESVNKLLSSFIMTVLSWDRYLAVCSPMKSIRIRSNSVACLVLLLCSALAVLLLLPVVLNAKVVHVDVHTGSLISSNENDAFYKDGNDNNHQITLVKCIFEGSSPTFMYYTFACGFLLPALLITYFYLNVIAKLRKSAANIRRYSEIVQQQQNTNMRIRQVIKRIVTMILFYFFCWAPHWTINLLAHFGLIVVSWSTLTLSSIFFAAHLLVCFNSAANPIMYALINHELRQQHTQALIRRRRSLSNVTNAVLDVHTRHSSHQMKDDNSLSPLAAVMQFSSLSNTTTISGDGETPIESSAASHQQQPIMKNNANRTNIYSDVMNIQTLSFFKNLLKYHNAIEGKFVRHSSSIISHSSCNL
ncbi:unnamed protein product [Thelazia callipaeda]|uniref:G_PROTEIN_RECEP_F1_2 domain-containing protein n=1 Tax=Thelazia callipaeda TaxID=103827 RepID=A0A0N5CKB1_THECL|nr:unnamed protein product [Thelazia callipaeda]